MSEPRAMARRLPNEPLYRVAVSSDLVEALPNDEEIVSFASREEFIAVGGASGTVYLLDADVRRAVLGLLPHFGLFRLFRSLSGKPAEPYFGYVSIRLFDVVFFFVYVFFVYVFFFFFVVVVVVVDGWCRHLTLILADDPDCRLFRRSHRTSVSELITAI